MKALILLAFLGVALGAAVPLSEPKDHLARASNSANLLAVATIPEWEIQSSDWLSDLIEAIIGLKVVQLLTLINDTLVGSAKLVEKAVTQLNLIVLEVSAEIKRELEAIINDALTEALDIMQPILDQMSKILPALPKPESVVDTSLETFDLVSDIILALLGITLEKLLTDITDALENLNGLLNQTFRKLGVVAAKVAASIAEKINDVIDSTLADAVALVQPLLELLGQIFPLNLSIIGQLIQAFKSLDFPALFTEANIVFPKIEQIGKEANIEIQVALAEVKPEVAEKIDGILRSAMETAVILLDPVLRAWWEMFLESGKLVLNYINNLHGKMSGMSVEDFVVLLIATFEKLDDLIYKTIAKILDVENGTGVDIALKIQTIIDRALSRIDFELKPIIKLLKPIFDVLIPPESNRALELVQYIKGKRFWNSLQ